MKDPERITEILGKIKKLWKANNDWRLGQLLMNAIYTPDSGPVLDPGGFRHHSKICPALFYLEDEELLKRLNRLNKTDRYHHRLTVDTPEKSYFLNELNRILRKTEREIMERVRYYLTNLAQQKKTDPFTSDYEVGVSIEYFESAANEWDDGFLHNFHTWFDHDRDVVKKDDFFWHWEKLYSPEHGDPALEEPCSYLMHDLVSHSGLGNTVFDIHTIWVDIQLRDQQCLLLEDGKWKVKV